MLIKAAVLHDYKQDFVMEDVELAEPEFDEVLVKIAASGVCHTDELVRDGFAVPMPAVLGHEGSGVVEKVGTGVKSVVPGDHVVLSFPYCGECPSCLSGRPNICYQSSKLCFGGRRLNGSTPLSQNGQPVSLFFGQSSFATYSVAHISNVVKVDPTVDLRLLGPLGCGIQTGAGAVINTLRPMPGSSIVIFGTGSVGLSGLMAAKACGCTTIVAVDVVAKRLEAAKKLGATHTINSREVPDLVAELNKITKYGLDYSFDTTGVPACVKAALQSLRRGGAGAGVAIVGQMQLESWSSLFSTKTWTNVIEGDSMPQLFIPRLIDMYKAGIFPLDKITTFFDFKDINKAFEASHDGTAVKPVLVMNEA